MGISLFQFQKGFLCSQSGLIDCSRGPFGPGWQAGRTIDGIDLKHLKSYTMLIEMYGMRDR